ncbi:hypothetical protein Zm00014a_008350 [Zea mays]|uniref:Uncharacterized protein n=1 Tax=Zea mays TaxID=4577 RepID=A0A3L6EJK5_MAIZE|nr:hypothetical protein Zm00014a_008350 [Zea mays]
MLLIHVVNCLPCAMFIN